MMKKRYSKDWIPFWVDKWIFGSMRLEFTLEERAIWVDLLALGAKDDGYIRANEDCPYPIKQLAGLLNIPEDKLKKAIDKFVKTGKLTRLGNGILYITKWDDYQLSKTAKYYAEKGRGERKSSHGDQQGSLYSNSKSNSKSKSNTYTHGEITKFFEDFWEAYPRKVHIEDAEKAFGVLIKQVPVETIAAALNGYNEYLKQERSDRGLTARQQKRFIKYPASLLRSGRWKDFLGVKYTPPL